MLQRNFHIITFGCQMNTNDSFWLSCSLQKKGFQEVSLEDASIIIINTCSVREKPEQKVYSILGKIRHATKNNPDSFVVIAGCVAQQLGATFFEKFPQVRLVSGSDGIAMAPDAIERLYAEPDLKLNLTDFSEYYPEREYAFSKLTLSNNNTLALMAYVNIMQGCDNYCTYCIVPYTRGKQKSRSVQAIVEECQQLIDSGVKEIVLLGQNVNAYGLDKDKNSPANGVNFAMLVHTIASLPGLERLRFFSAHPKEFSSELIDLFGEFSTLCPRLHLPLQSGSDKILRRMGRKYSMDEYISIITKLKKVRPDIALSTDFIVGFPGETEEDFLQTLQSINTIKFMSSFSFCYSDRPGTRSSTFSNKVDHEVKIKRLEQLQATQLEHSTSWLKSRVGVETTVLLEKVSRKKAEDNNSWQGRDPWGNVVNVILPQSTNISNTLLPVRIIASKKHSLVAEPLII
ncbi:tRNA (N6-isopentenyl adenosine(37)-C2)-methylthiotransferase MiaB [Lawsonia intracellularis]|uniref:tRNA-2-methylthio-N(6)-dimethylallyladenosine synthase n=1 Tax=Lawsonia intracellularis (strain PHE/MN1-00) TaxID=363253 RepID=MIAB_LAWIP|nr:tRNA (N6-isopentenyl adenosine(37)-C2)-methylthiotransferase MiaB [Lawsonia intracellularis]Q1MQ52.1 RecName: Full=tRNA-2-methylthio-N(6)-dimethylallyladenosine synthase; AltName: Full=(Dimethylallyl)adenosine tRNA methylthiotransferase MiaB; AltName: Full=tRNA-i(6)A37 methylthiotransferase [Lawsonia intracellularis PHE/MN1-00]AGC50246.1 (dimethylallyl)adenosine tRNA methylthiotransferase [Lawsonia intracellularis N343]KAA0204267.1 tRNA (N6-isopentenyl adenosine(37)-C2)-methylthiotransferase 